MLSQFFATPSTMRFAAIVEEGQPIPAEAAEPQMDYTPLRTRIPSGHDTAEKENLSFDATPAYLKRSYSFKDRLLSASAAAKADSKTTHRDAIDTGLDISSPSTSRIGPPTLRRYQSAPKPLSEIVRGLRKIEDERHVDDMEVLREFENGETNVILADSQTQAGKWCTGDASENQPDGTVVQKRAWKKKGQKRTTRRVTMRPVTMKPPKPPRFVAAEETSESEDELARVEDSQFVKRARLENEHASARSESKDPALPDNLVDTGPEADVTHKHNSSDCDWDEHVEQKADTEHPDTHPPTRKKKSRNPKVAKVGTGGTTTTSPSTRRAAQSRKREPGTINPNATSHLNFRTLKIRSKKKPRAHKR